ncbi:hypothetical protein LAD64_23585 [Klebsiella pneumoniae]|nr:hypothetical protein [Klebsiella pneumoniae]
MYLEINFTLPFLTPKKSLPAVPIFMFCFTTTYSQTATACIPLGNMRKLGRQIIPAALFNIPTLAAGAAAAAGGGDKIPLAGQRFKQFVHPPVRNLFIPLPY